MDGDSEPDSQLYIELIEAIEPGGLQVHIVRIQRRW